MQIILQKAANTEVKQCFADKSAVVKRFGNIKRILEICYRIFYFILRQMQKRNTRKRSVFTCRERMFLNRADGFFYRVHRFVNIFLFTDF